MYIRKGGSYFVNTVTDFTLDDLQPYLFERVRIMTRNRSLSHPWVNMNDEEILRASGLIMKDSVKQKEGLTLAAILLFGKDTTIVSALPHHKTDAIVRIENTNRYDDRDVIITNLLESYDWMVAFCQKHLSNPFILEGAQSISARDKILREVCANSLVHRNYASGFVSQLVIEKERMLLINPSISYISGKLNLSSFRPFSKNPQISKVFREIGLADELGSGMRNTCKYTELYSGGEPSFIEESGMFRTEIPLSNVSLLKTGPERSFNLISSNFEGHDEGHDKGHDVIMEHVNELQQKILAFCSSPKTKREIVEYFGYKNPRTFSALYIKPLLNKELLRLLFPDKPKSKYQRYVRVDSNPSVNLLIGSHEGYQGEDEEVQLGKVENAPQVTDEFKISSPQVETDCAESTPQVTETERNIILFCTGTPRSVIEIMDFLDLSDKKSFRSRYLVPLLGKGVLKMTIPNKPTSRNQRYVRAENEEKDWK